MAALRNRAPVWFWIVAALILLWGLAGVAAFYMDVTMSAEKFAELPDYDRQLMAGRPQWYIWLYGVAVWSGLLAAVVLLLRSAIAYAGFVLSLIAVIAMFGYIFATTDLIAVKGFVEAAGFPAVIAAIAAFQVWLAQYARRRGWIV